MKGARRQFLGEAQRHGKQRENTERPFVVNKYVINQSPDWKNKYILVFEYFVYTRTEFTVF